MIFGANPKPQTVCRTPFAYASFLGISEALHLDIFKQPQRNMVVGQSVFVLWHETCTTES